MVKSNRSGGWVSHDERARRAVVLLGRRRGDRLPILLVLLTELQHALRRRGSIPTRPVYLLRTYILPLGALLILLVQAMQISGEDHTGSRWQRCSASSCWCCCCRD